MSLHHTCASQAVMQSVGFTFHQGPHPDTGADTFWYCWCGPAGTWDVESGDYCDSENAATANAVEKYVAFNEGVRAAIVEMNTGPDDPRPDDYSQGEDDPNYRVDSILCEVVRTLREGAEDRLLPPQPTDPVGIVRAALRGSRQLFALCRTTGGSNLIDDALAVLPYLTTIGERS